MNPGLDRKLPAIQVRLHQNREFFFRDGIDFIRRTDHPVAKAAGLIKGLEVNRIVGVTIQFQQSLINPLEEPDNITLVVRFLEDTHPDTTELGTAFHQGLVTQQHGLTEQTRLVHQH